MSKLIFMSAEHVDHMNQLLAADTASKAACARLDRRWNLLYELSNQDRTVWWTMSFDPAAGVSFTLQPPEQAADVVFRGDYAAVLDTMRRMKAGEKHLQLPLTQEGDATALGVIGPAYGAAHAAAAIDTDIPQA